MIINKCKPFAALLSLLIAAMLLLSGCGASSSDSFAYESAKEDFSIDSIDPYDDYDSYEYTGNADYSTALLSNEAAAETAQPAPADPGDNSGKTGDASGKSDVERKIIRNADIGIEAENASECYKSILDYAVSLGGYESSSRMSKDEYSSGRNISIYATLKLPPDKLDEFTAHVGEYGDVRYSNISSEEITETYYDLKTRLSSKQKALDNYYKLLDKAETIDEILSIQSRIDSLTEDIESVKGKLRVYDSLVEESTVELTITEDYNYTLEEKEFTWDSLTFSSFLKLIKNGFLGVCNFLWSLLQWIVIIVISASPIIIIAAGIIFLIRRLKKKGIIKSREKKAKISQPAPVYTAGPVQNDTTPVYGGSKDQSDKNEEKE